MPEQLAGKGEIEVPGDTENIVWQTRPAVPSVYETDLADALIACFENGVVELAALAKALNERQVLSPSGVPWTEDSLAAEMARLGV